MLTNERPSLPDEMERQTDFGRIHAGILDILGKRNLLHAPVAEQSAALTSFLEDADRDSAFFTENRDLADVLADFRAYHGADFAVFAARRLQIALEKEGKYSDKKTFQEKIFLRKQALRGWRTFPDNFAFSYGVEPETHMAHIHLSNPYIEKGGDDFSGASGAAILRMFLHGLKSFAKEVESDPSIDKVSATSVLLSRPEFVTFMEKLGFVNQGEIPGELKRRHFMNETRPVIGLEAKRQSFLEAMRGMDFRQLQTTALKALRAAK